MTVLDFPEVIDLMADELAQAGIATIKGDATQAIPAQGFDLVFCGNLFHSMSPAECAQVVAERRRRPGLRRCFGHPRLRAWHRSVLVAVCREHARGDQRR